MITLMAYIFAALSTLYLALCLFSQRVKNRWISVILQAGAVLFLFISLIHRSVEMKYMALTGMFDSLLFFAMVIISISIFLNLQKKIHYPNSAQFGVILLALGLLLVGTSPIINKEVLPPIPALQSAWLLLHVSFSFIGESFLVFSFVTSLLLLRSKDKEKMVAYDNLSYRAILVGYSFFTLGALIFGAIWAQAAWGRFWGWDPKETWALITWIIYSIYLHFRLIKKAGSRLCSWIAVVGFIATMFTFFGVNYLVKFGLHSY